MMNPFRKMRSSVVIAMAAALSLCLQAAGSEDSTDTSGWRDLLQSDLSNASGAEEWTVRDGVLVATGHRTLWTRESYGNFVLDLEFKVTEDANSGVFLRSGDINKVLAALEIQVHASTDGTKYGMVGALYDAKPPSKSVAKPVGDWNRLTITCAGPAVTVELNGERILDIDLDDWTEARMNPDGTPNKFPVALKDYSRAGPIGFQGLHGKAQAPVWYRNITIKPLE